MVALGTFGQPLRGAEPPVILVQPVPVNATTGQDVEMEVTAAGLEPFTYRWRKDGTTVARAQSSLLLRSVTTNHTGLYSVIVANSAGSVTSSVVTLTVDLPDVGVRLQPRGSVDGFAVGVGSGAPVRIQIRGHHAFVADGWDDSLHVVDIRDPDEPRRVAMTPMTPGYSRPFDVALIDDFALTAERTAGLGIIDVSDPAAPVRIGNFVLPGSFASSVVLRGRRAFVGNENAGLVILDVNVPESPAILGNATPPTPANGLDLDGNRALIACWDQGLSVVDISDLASPVQHLAVPYGNGAARAFDVVSKDTVAYMADGGLGVVALDLSQSPVQQLAQFGTGTWDLALTDRYLWAGGESLELFNVSTPEKVIPLGFYLDRGKALGVLIRGNRLFMCERHFNIIDLEFFAMAPVVLSPTEERQIASGSDVVLEAYATGTEPMAYRWFHDNTELDAISGPTLTLAKIGTSDLGEYSVEVSNAFGSITHTVASLSAGRQVDPVTWISPAAGQLLVIGESYSLEAETGAGRPTQFFVAAGTADLDGNTVTPRTADALTVRAVAAGDSQYLVKAAERSFQVVDRPRILPDTVRIESGHLNFSVSVANGAPFAVSSSDNLLDWTELVALVATAPVTEIIDPRVPTGMRFYRVELRLPQ
jgi:hypothetical protein